MRLLAASRPADISQVSRDGRQEPPTPDLFDLLPGELPQRPAAPVVRPAATVAARSVATVGLSLLLRWYLAGLVVCLVLRFPLWAVLALPVAGAAVQVLRGRRRSFRLGCAVVAATYVAETTSIVVSPYPWWFRFATSSVLFAAASYFWGARVDSL